jgi:hypothetical protein
MTARKTEEKMIGDRNRLLGLILEWMMMMMKLYLNRDVINLIIV